MGKIIKSMFVVFLGLISFVCVACEKKSDKPAEEITLAKTILGEVEFENSDKVKLKQDNDEWIISGEIETMSPAQASAFGVEGINHVVVVKFMFDKERTIDYFKIKGETTKVYSTDKTDENYVGSISSLLDSESGEDAFCYLILSAKTKEYELTSKYTDGIESTVELKIEATLSQAISE